MLTLRVTPRNCLDSPTIRLSFRSLVIFCIFLLVVNSTDKAGEITRLGGGRSLVEMQLMSRQTTIYVYTGYARGFAYRSRMDIL